MDDSTSPSNWFAGARSREWIERRYEMKLKPVDHPSLFPSIYLSPDVWWANLSHVQAFAEEGWFTKDVLECYARILCQALEVPQDCKRDLHCDESHDLRIFANPRTFQVYCCHNFDEKAAFNRLVKSHFYFNYYRCYDLVDGQNYEVFTRNAYLEVSQYIAWECILPDGLDMEALSPRDANAHMRAQKSAPKLKPPVPKVAQKEKDHPPPPPAEVREPPCSDRPNGAIYQTGKCLGKGGFAICYEGQLAGSKQLYALKMVRSHMPMKKMEQKFQTELQIHSKMRHPNIVQFHRAFSYEKCTYIVLELCPNGSLMDMVKKRKFVTEPEVRFWTVQMAGGIKYMHSKGIIHRDLKMGNIFLDKDMNIKIGDFGLAALLMSGKDMVAVRRTTLCGTPNYIAPEILEKNKGGHDHAVDIWSLGIIIFAMLTGKPPFQSTTADEIYRRAREREYDWPKMDTSENFISDETKNLVSILLQSPENRPDPDTIVQHPFFTCGWMPQSQEITPELRDRHPHPTQFLTVGARAGRTSLYTRNLKKLCVECEVGPWNKSPKRYTSTYREVAAEEKAGLTPNVPLPEDVVYRPFEEWLQEQAIAITEAEEDAEPASEPNRILESLPSSKLNDRIILPSNRPSAQSFAAQQRARPQVSNPPSRTVRSRKVDAETQQGQQVPRSSSESNVRPTRAISSRSAKSNPQNLAFNAVGGVIDVEGRLAADLAKQLDTAPERKRQESDIPREVKAPLSLFSPRETLESMPGTKPDDILNGLRRLQAELERALNSRSTAAHYDSTLSNPTIVVKWVDYTNKFGLGYILSNGSVGCIFKSAPVALSNSRKGHIPPACVLVREAEWHLQNRNALGYADRHQLVPVSGPNIEFYESRGEQGISRGQVNPQNYTVSVDGSGKSGKLSRGRDEWDDRKREKIVLWRKFANYMTAYGKDQDFPYDDAVIRNNSGTKSEAADPGNVVTFYQRFGDVGCWGFSDGHFQFNFPDHTKIVISANGSWCDFYHLPLEAARDLSQNGTLPASALDDRQRLSYPLQTLLNFMCKPSKSTTRRRPEIDPMIQGIPQANNFRKKIEFIRLVVKEWVTNGGLGNSNMEPEGRLRWTGCREVVNVKAPYKHVWVTVGARGGDDRRVAWFDPKKPEAIVPDIE